MAYQQKLGKIIFFRCPPNPTQRFSVTPTPESDAKNKPLDQASKPLDSCPASKPLNTSLTMILRETQGEEKRHLKQQQQHQSHQHKGRRVSVDDYQVRNSTLNKPSHGLFWH